MFLILILYTILASTFTLGKMLLSYAPPLFLIGLRMVFSGIVLLAGYTLFGKQKIILRKKDWFVLFGISLIHIFIPYASEFIAMQTISPSCAALMFNLSPFFSALFSYVYFKEKMTRLKWIGMAISFVGLLYFVWPETLCLSQVSGMDLAYPLLLIGVITSTLAWVVIRVFIKDKHYSPIFINGVAMLLGGIESFAMSYAISEPIDFPWCDTLNFIVLFLTIVLFSNIFYNFYGYLLKKYTATFLALMGIATPLITALFDWWLLGINIHMNFIITTVLIGLGVYLFYKEELKLGYIVEK